MRTSGVASIVAAMLKSATSSNTSPKLPKRTATSDTGTRHTSLHRALYARASCGSGTMDTSINWLWPDAVTSLNICAW